MKKTLFFAGKGGPSRRFSRPNLPVKRMMFSLLLLAAVMGAWGQAVPGTVVNGFTWVPTKDVKTTFTGTVDGEPVGKTMEDHLVGILVNEFNGITASPPLNAEHLRSNDYGNNRLKTEEAIYYFKENNFEALTSNLDNHDILTIKSVDKWQKAKAELNYIEGNTVGGHYCYSKIHFALKVDFWNIVSSNIGEYYKVSYRDSWLSVSKDSTYNADYPDLSIKELINSDSTLTPYTYRVPFLRTAENFISIGSWRTEDWSNTSINGKCLTWTFSDETVYIYKAKEPQLYSNLDTFKPTEGYHMGDRKHNEFDFRTKQRVKVLTAVVYKKSGNKYSFMKSISNKIDEGKEVKNLFIGGLYEELKVLNKTVDGEYILVMGAIDLFNKIYLYKPVNMFVDNTSPVVTNPVSKVLSTSSTAFSPADNLFLKWDNISDNFTLRDNESDFIYIKVGAGNPVKITDFPVGSSKAFTVKDKTIIINKVDGNLPVENYTNVDIFVVDDVGNRNYLAAGVDFSYSSTKPRVEMKELNRIYRSGESVNFEVKENNEKLRFAKVRIAPTLPVGANSKIIPVGMPAVLSASRFTNLKASLTAAENVLLDSWYILSPGTGFYEINPAISDSDEASLRALLTNCGVIEFGPIKGFSVPPGTLAEGEYNLFIELVDPAQNSNDVTNREFTIKVTTSTDDVRMSLKDVNAANVMVLPEGVVAEYNPVGTLLIEKIEPAVTSYDLSVTSLGLGTGLTGITVNKTGLTAVEHIETLTPTLDSELLEIVVTAHYGVVKTVQYKRRVTVYKDSAAPLVSSVDNGDGSFTVTVTDSSAIKHVAVKEVGLDASGNPLPLAAPTFINGSWALAEWSEQSGDLKSNSFTLYPAPGRAYYIFAVDRWNSDNGTAMTTVKGSSGPVNMTINNQTDLATYNYNLQGVVVINCNLNITSTETLTFTAVVGTPTTVYMKAGTKITNSGGVINLDAANAPISFRGIGESRNGYNWFGIVNASGALKITSTNRISFSSAEAALTVSVPGTTGNFMTNATLSGLGFTNCLIGIHWLDNGAAYQKLTVSNSSFTNCVYGVKLDLIAGSYGDVSDTGYINYVLIDNTNSFNNMSRAKFYWNGLDF